MGIFYRMRVHYHIHFTSAGVLSGEGKGLKHNKRKFSAGKGHKNPAGHVGDKRSKFKSRAAAVPGYIRWTQTYEGIPVYGAELITHVDTEGKNSIRVKCSNRSRHTYT